MFRVGDWIKPIFSKGSFKRIRSVKIIDKNVAIVLLDDSYDVHKLYVDEYTVKRGGRTSFISKKVKNLPGE
jgi:hypothetical protein